MYYYQDCQDKDRVQVFCKSREGSVRYLKLEGRVYDMVELKTRGMYLLKSLLGGTRIERWTGLCYSLQLTAYISRLDQLKGNWIEPRASSSSRSWMIEDEI